MRMDLELADEALAFLRREATIPSSAPSLPLPVRDPDDVVVLSEAIAGLADVVVTGDGDILEAEEALPLSVVTSRGFWELILRRGRS